jgi:hypothetical protein
MQFSSLLIILNQILKKKKLAYNNNKHLARITTKRILFSCRWNLKDKNYMNRWE